MESFGPWKLIKAGFWIGIGFIVPSIGVYILGSQLLYAMPVMWQTDATETMAQFMEDADKTRQVKITEFRESTDSNRLLILGVVENAGETPVSSIRLEAELFDDNKKMVFECSEYISKKLGKGERENFQINCGCGNQTVPEYSSISVRVISANNY